MSELIEKETTKQAVKPPSMWQVVLLNDDYTTVEFVIDCLIYVFNKSEDEAARITMDVHKKGKGIVGRYTKDIALTKQSDAQNYAKSQGHPLQVLAEPEA
jgi:ATP-dependent Clp protease adaptor protein ClpS